MSGFLTNLAYIAAAVLFIFGIKMLGSAGTARRGNLLSAVGMLLAVVVTFLEAGLGQAWIWIGLAIGAAIGAVWARVVKMTAMPELVALFNGFGGLASALVAWAEYQSGFVSGGLAATGDYPVFRAGVISIATWIGALTFTGSGIAFGKLSGRLSGKPQALAQQKKVMLLLFGGGILAAVLFLFLRDQAFGYLLFLVVLAAGLTVGVLGTRPIGGGDMPVVIALLNSLSGLAAAGAGFAIENNVLIVAGCLVGCSGLILTVIMCKAMNRKLVAVLFGGFGGTPDGPAVEVDGEMKASNPGDAYYVLEAAHSVAFVPGYGMAVAQAQHVVKELADLLEARGTEVFFAIHPVAGRMPGHMNVLLAEADVPYEQLLEMEAANQRLPTVDVAIVIGANDVVNPAAAEDASSPIYGMPIVEARQARTIYALKRGQGAGFSGLPNQLYFLPQTSMLYGDAKETLSALVKEFQS